MTAIINQTLNFAHGRQGPTYLKQYMPLYDIKYERMLGIKCHKYMPALDWLALSSPFRVDKSIPKEYTVPGISSLSCSK